MTHCQRITNLATNYSTSIDRLGLKKIYSAEMEEHRHLLNDCSRDKKNRESPREPPIKRPSSQSTAAQHLFTRCYTITVEQALSLKRKAIL